jgi:hypothetical protein
MTGHKRGLMVDRSNRPSIQRLHDLLRCDFDNGFLYWKNSRGSKKAGSLAGNIRSDGYFALQIDGKKYLTHIVIYAMFYGFWSDQELDHKNRDRSDNRISNLRTATRSQNIFNSTGRLRKAPFKSVQFRNGKWRARISVARKRIHLGYFPTAEEASEAYQIAAVRYYGEYVPGPIQ